MAGLTKEQLNSNKIVWVNIDKDTCHFEYQENGENKSFPAFDGTLLGFSQEKGSYPSGKYAGTEYTNFCIWIKDNERIFQIKNGFYTFRALFIMNFLRSIPKFEQKPIKLVASNGDKTASVIISYNNNWLKGKVKYADLKLPDNTEKRDKKKNAIIDKWYEDLYSQMPYNPTPVAPITIDAESDDDEDILF